MHIKCEKNGQTRYDILNISFCCEEMEKGWEKSVLWDDYNRKLYVTHVEMWNGSVEDVEDFPISFCPFCGSHIYVDMIDLEEIEKENQRKKEEEEQYYIELVSKFQTNKKHIYLLDPSPKLESVIQNSNVQIFKKTDSSSMTLHDIKVIYDRKEYAIDYLLIRASSGESNRICHEAKKQGIKVLVMVSDEYKHMKEKFQKLGAVIVSNLPNEFEAKRILKELH